MISFEWLYDVFISKHLKTESYRKLALNEMEKIQQKLKDFEQKSSNALEKLNSAEQTILKRLEWAVPSKPALNDVKKVFEEQRKKRNDFFKVILALIWFSFLTEKFYLLV
jgi:hypothetical protein